MINKIHIKSYEKTTNRNVFNFLGKAKKLRVACAYKIPRHIMRIGKKYI